MLLVKARIQFFPVLCYITSYVSKMSWQLLRKIISPGFLCLWCARWSIVFILSIIQTRIFILVVLIMRVQVMISLVFFVCKWSFEMKYCIYSIKYSDEDLYSCCFDHKCPAICSLTFNRNVWSFDIRYPTDCMNYSD